jgi:hypothetical protein
MKSRWVSCCAITALSLLACPARVSAQTCEIVEDARVDGVGSDSHFGQAIAVDGDTVFVGKTIAIGGGFPEYRRHGTLLEYTGSGWSPLLTIQSVADTRDRLSDSPGNVAINATHALLGSMHEAKVYALLNDGSGWTSNADITVAGVTDADQFGCALVLDGDTAFVGAHRDNVPGTINAGSVFILTWNGSTWPQDQQITADVMRVDADFGYSLDVSGDLLVVGAPGESVDSILNSGAVYIFRNGVSGWTQEARLTLEVDIEDARFGESVAIDGDRVVVGIPERSQAIEPGAPLTADVGSVEVFRYTGSAWVFEQEFRPPVIDNQTFFGHDVDIEGDQLIIGAKGESSPASRNGAAYVFKYNTSGQQWEEAFRLLADDAGNSDNFGSAVILNNGDIVVGSPRWDNSSPFANGAGAVYFFDDPYATDCNNNGVPDACEEDCDGNGIPDECDIASFPGDDCDGNGILDVCEVDCDSNGTADVIEICADPDLDCNGNWILDICDGPDCNNNGVPDECDILSREFDCDQNGLVDECEVNGLNVVFIIDYSASMDEFNGNNGATCEDLFTEIDDLRSAGYIVNATYLGVDEDPRLWCFGTAPVEMSNVIDMFGTTVPPLPVSGTPAPSGDTGQISVSEDWGGAVAIVASEFDWPALGRRIIVVLSDEYPFRGGAGVCLPPSEESVVPDYDIVNFARQMLDETDVACVGIYGDEQGNLACMNTFMSILVSDTDGAVLDFFTDATVTQTLSDLLPTFINTDCNGNGVLDACDIIDATSNDCDDNDIPDECDIRDQDPSNPIDADDNCIIDTCEGQPCPWDCEPDNGDGTWGDGKVDVSDFFGVLQNYSSPQNPTCAAPCPWDCEPDNGDGTFGDGVVDVDDFFGVLQHWGFCTSAPSPLCPLPPAGGMMAMGGGLMMSQSMASESVPMVGEVPISQLDPDDLLLFWLGAPGIEIMSQDPILWADVLACLNMGDDQQAIECLTTYLGN